MLGAVIGDTIGSTYEFHNTKDYNFKLFPEGSKYTDDSIMSFAVASWLMRWCDSGSPDARRIDSPESYQCLEDEFVRLGKMFPSPKGGYGGGFVHWLHSPQTLQHYDEKKYGTSPYESTTGRHPYGSWGNGSAMRAAPVGWFFDDIEQVLLAAKVSAAITHNHPAGIAGAQAVAVSVFLARNGRSKEEIRDCIERRFGYDLHKTWEEWYKVYGWDSSCQGTVPQAFIAFFDSTGFEDAIRKAVTLGGDTDTLTCITGAVAEAFYKEIPSVMVFKTLGTLPKVLRDILDEFQKRVNHS